MEEQKKFLHGTLEVTIFDATPYSPPFPFTCIQLKRPTPAYVSIKINNKNVAKTSPERDRVWNQTFQITCAHSAADTTLTITLRTHCSILGLFRISAQQILTVDPAVINGVFPLASASGTKPNPNLKLKFLIWFKPAYLEPGWCRAIEGQSFQGIKSASFPQRSNCRVVLYQDAHHTTSFNPRVTGVSWSPRNLWEDVYRAIHGARHFVYIAGWALNPNLVLIRDSESEIQHGIGVTIGKLLRCKADEGVAVRILLWNDETSLPLIKNKGAMCTKDQTAFSYFRNTKVVCKLCPRSHNKHPTAFAHHQKTITVDTRVPNPTTNEREITSFLGGLDLFDGRYDTEEHSLFRTLGPDRSKFPDFYQTSVPGARLSRGGPREPWHDCHASVVGEAAYDILRNFEQRWTKQCDPSLLLNISGIKNLVINPQQDRTWNVQVLRSIDHVSATEMPRGLAVEKSIHEAYVEAIRRAERFIYIENQYFMGSSHLWENKNHKDTSGCTNLIPVEIALKIAAKIRARERFMVYIVMPMWPEGPPEGEAVEEMPRDYLSFFCLANREEKRDGEFMAPSSPSRNSQYWKAQNNRRFMIYVHSKLMIGKSRHLVIGSANINQRSMDGQRDTEIGIGCYQPKADMNTNDIRAYRISLWYEHTGGRIAPDDLSSWDPESLECIRSLQTLGKRMWEIYSSDHVVDMGGVHLVAYPISITDDGVVHDVGDGVFPDTKAPVKGQRSRMLPPILTTMIISR